MDVLEYHIHLTLHPDSDADLIVFLSDIPKGMRASRIKAALRAGGMEKVSVHLSQEEEREIDQDIDALFE